MQQYVFSMTSRMVTIAAACALLLCVLLFVLGIEIGARFNTTPPADTAMTSSAHSVVSTDTVPPQPAAQGANDLAAVPASSTL